MPNTAEAPNPVVRDETSELIEAEKKSNKIIYLLFGVIFLLIVIGIGGLFYVNSKKSVKVPVAKTNNFTGISGTVDLNGTPPSGSTISIGVTTPGVPTVQTVATGINAQDNTVWAWNGAQAGSIYQVTAYLNYNGQIVSQSTPITIAAPAEQEVLTINYQVTSAAPSPAASTSISGTVGIDGFIPAGSTIAIGARPLGQTVFSTIASGITAVDGATWSWNNAITDQDYEVVASLVQNSNVISQSPIATMSAPAAAETLNINSTSQPPAPQPVGISGNINLNGLVSSGSYVTLGYRVTGSGAFTSVPGNIPASDNSTWNIPNLNSGASYDIQAYLWTNNQPFSQSQILTIPAPASNETLTINATQSPTNTPTAGSINASCGNSQNNNWQANVTYNVGGNIQNAAQYQVTIGTSSQGNNVYNTTVSPSNPNSQQSISTPYVLNNNVTYYVQYAYATCQTCGSFSSFSPSVALTCN